MEKQLRIGRSERTISVIDDLVVLKPTGRVTRDTRKRPSRDLDGLPVVDIDMLPRDILRSDANALAQAGWLFALSDERLVHAARAGSELRGGRARELAITEGGRVLLVGETLLVGFPEDIETKSAFERMRSDGLSAKRRVPVGGNVFEVRTLGAESTLNVAARLQAEGGYTFAEPAFEEVLAHRVKPSDPDYPKQWQWNNDGSGGGLVGADARLERAWDVTTGIRTDTEEPVAIAVVDGGIDLDHPELAHAVRYGGYFEDTGTGSATFIAHPTGSFPKDDHGTFCAGVAVARANNRQGGCGAAYDAQLIPVACLDDQVGTQATLARALVYAALPSNEDPSVSDSQGADVISCSLGPNDEEWIMQSVLELAIDRVLREGRGGLGTPIFWAVSNSFHPVAKDEVCSHANVISVGCSTRLDQSGGSTYGPELDFLAPGVDVFGILSGGGYGVLTGTSYAAPLAAAVGALVITVAPTSTWDAVRTKLRSACDRVGPHPYVNGRNDEYGYGRINAHRSVR